jgi:hypothetical protein
MVMTVFVLGTIRRSKSDNIGVDVGTITIFGNKTKCDGKIRRSRFETGTGLLRNEKYETSSKVSQLLSQKIEKVIFTCFLYCYGGVREYSTRL